MVLGTQPRSGAGWWPCTGLGGPPRPAAQEPRHAPNGPPFRPPQPDHIRLEGRRRPATGPTCGRPGRSTGIGDRHAGHCIHGGRKAPQRDGRAPLGSAPGAPAGGRHRGAPCLRKEPRRKIRAAARADATPPLATRGACRGQERAQGGGAEGGVEAGRASASSHPSAAGGSSPGRHPAPPAAKSTRVLKAVRASRQDHGRTRQRRISHTNRSAGRRGQSRPPEAIPALPYAPGGNAAEPQIQTAKAAQSNVGPDSAGAMRGKLRRCIESGLIEPVRLCGSAAAGRPAVDRLAQGGVRQKRPEPG